MRRRLPYPLLIGAVVVVVLALVPPMIGGYIVRALTSYMIFGLLALAVGLITGYGRLFNLGVGANFGVSAYTVAVLTHFQITNPVELLVAALLAGLIVSLLFSFYALVASGIEYLMLTFLTTAAFAAVPLATCSPWSAWSRRCRGTSWFHRRARPFRPLDATPAAPRRWATACRGSASR